MEITWKPEYNLEIREIDQQHRKLVETINHLNDAITNNQVAQELTVIFDQLIDYAVNHFHTEEKYFDRFHYEFTEEHKAIHQRFKNQINDFYTQFKNHQVAFSFKLINFLEDWLHDHLLTEDRKYLECFKKNGLK